MAASNSSASKNSASGNEQGEHAEQSEQAAQGDRADDTQVPSYEEARDELVEVVRRLEAGGTTLEESLTLWERGEELARICQSWLQGARERLARAERQGEQDTADNDAEER